MTISQDVLAVAVRELGYRELGDNRNKFGAWYGMDYQPWCAMFVSYCFYTVGLPLPITTGKGFAYVLMVWSGLRTRIDGSPLHK